MAFGGFTFWSVTMLHSSVKVAYQGGGVLLWRGKKFNRLYICVSYSLFGRKEIVKLLITRGNKERNSKPFHL